MPEPPLVPEPVDPEPPGVGLVEPLGDGDGLGVTVGVVGGVEPPDPPEAGMAGTVTSIDAVVTSKSVAVVRLPMLSLALKPDANSRVLVPDEPGATELVALMVQRVELVCTIEVIAERPVSLKSTPGVVDKLPH